MSLKSKSFTDSFISLQNYGGWLVQDGEGYSHFRCEDVDNDATYNQLVQIVSRNEGESKPNAKLVEMRDQKGDWMDVPHGAACKNKLIDVYSHIEDEMESIQRVKARVLSVGGLHEVAKNLITDFRYGLAHRLKNGSATREDAASVEATVEEFINHIGYDPTVQKTLKMA